MSPSVQQLSVIGKDTETFQAAVSQDIRFDIFVFTPIERAATHCQRTARTPSGVAPGWARPCACRLEDTPPRSGFHQSTERSEMRKPIAEGER